MTNLENKFFDKYKECDSFIRDAYNSSTGVSEYIDRMDAKAYIGSYRVQGWDDDYKSLKHYRWVRNQLAHNASVDAGICNEADYKWLCCFYSRLLHADDPLSILRKIQTAAKPKQSSAQKQKVSMQTKSQATYDPPSSSNNSGCLLKCLRWLLIFLIIILIISIIYLCLQR